MKKMCYKPHMDDDVIDSIDLLLKEIESNDFDIDLESIERDSKLNRMAKEMNKKTKNTKADKKQILIDSPMKVDTKKEEYKLEVSNAFDANDIKPHKQSKQDVYKCTSEALETIFDVIRETSNDGNTDCIIDFDDCIDSSKFILEDIMDMQDMCVEYLRDKNFDVSSITFYDVDDVFYRLVIKW